MDRASQLSGEPEPELVQHKAVISVLVVDDICLSREGLADQLRHDRWAGEVRTAANMEAAVRSLRSFLPDVVLLSLASADGLAMLAAMRVVAPAVRVIALAVTETEDEIVACAEAGVAGFLPRSGTLEHLKLAVAGVVRGETVCSPRVAGALLRRVSVLAAARTGYTDTTHLTPREREILVLIDQGMTNQQIAQRLSIAVRTVKNHVHNLLEKLRVRRRGEAAARLRSTRVPAFEVLHDASGGTRPTRGGYQTPVSPTRIRQD